MKTEEIDNSFESATANHSEAPIIDIRDFAQYQKKLSEIMETVNNLGDEIHDGMFGLALLDKWKEWDEKQPVGTELYVNDDMLRNTGDKNIDLLWGLLDKIMDVRDVIHVSKPEEDATDDDLDFVEEKSTIDSNFNTRIRHSLFGFVLGDCLGVPYEFNPPGKFKFKPFAGNGRHDMPSGTWSDDTALTLAFLNSIVDGEYDETKHKNNLKRFMKGEYFPDGRCYDVGIATGRAINSDFALSMDDSFGNGGLLRIWTLVAFSLLNEWTAQKEREIMLKALALTHSTKELYVACCELYFGLLRSLYRGEKDLERHRLWYEEISELPDFEAFKDKEGHICNAIYNVFDTFFKFPEYDDVMIPMRHIIEKGFDTDSNAALLGALLGAKQAIPTNYLKKIRGIERIDRYFLTDDQKRALERAKRYAAEDGYFGEVIFDEAFITDPEVADEVREWREELKKSRKQN